MGNLALPGATLTGMFQFSRTGTALVVQLTSLMITATSGGSTVAVNLTDTLSGVAPMGMVWTNGPGTCAAPQTNQTAVIAGLALQLA